MNRQRCLRLLLIALFSVGLFAAGMWTGRRTASPAPAAFAGEDFDGVLNRKWRQPRAEKTLAELDERIGLRPAQREALQAVLADWERDAREASRVQLRARADLLEGIAPRIRAVLDADQQRVFDEGFAASRRTYERLLKPKSSDSP